MITRRQFVFATGAAIAAPLVVLGCSSGVRADGYDEVVEKTWRAAEHSVSSRSSLQRELVRHATLAPSSHTDKMAMEQVLEYVVRGNTTQLNDAAFLEEQPPARPRGSVWSRT